MQDLKKIFSYMKPYRMDFFLAVLLVIIESAFEMVIPVIMTDIVDVGVPARDIPYLLLQGGKMAVCAVLSLISGLAYAKFAARAAYGFGAELRLAQYSRIQDFAFSNLDHFSTPSLVTRMTTDVTVMQNAVNGGLRPMVRGPVMLILGVGLSLMLNPRLALVFIIAAPVLGVILAFIVHKVSPLYNRQQTAVDHVNSHIQESLTAIRAIKAFVRGDYEAEVFQDVNGELADASCTTFKFAVLNLPAFQAVLYTAIVLIMWNGGRYILAGSMTVGELTAFLSYALQVLNSLMMISNVFLMLTRSLTSARRISEILDEKTALDSPKDPVMEIPDGEILFQDVSFKYFQNAKKSALSHVNLHIRAGESVGIIGGTGSAKSTLVQLIPRLYDATRGSVLVGGHNVKEYDLSALRDAVGIVLQKNVLFSGTVRENLLWGNKEADDDALWEACRKACADEFLSAMPKGLDTDLGQGGVNISGGQKQRLCIARTLLKNPKVLIFDDSTSAVDTATEGKIRHALRSLPDVTKIIIAQRVTSVMEADKIVILDDGRIHAVGTHQELLASDPIYQEIYASQMKGQKDASGAPSLQKGGISLG
ncbi:MAG TPA: ABC transporter ATP-binding protein/permease [Candidatus Blautia faecigallinarum]|uniref:ABC transporter ATP-binding protein/permease n=1 Tax=Candidatus Blautia faecigallinarum TaxID=2838488 RepID=A0A9D2ISA9_9FIRM|nr:ABC transporter ATP-binding protein/permease [Candidatus Blautia faecigallinarum]